MVQRKRFQGQSGKVQAQNSILILSKLLYQFLQCLHHVHNIQPLKGIQSKAFHQKQNELDRFVKPVQEVPGSSFRGIYQNLIQRFLINTLYALENHYHQRLDSLEQQITASSFSQLDIQTAYQWDGAGEILAPSYQTMLLSHFTAWSGDLNQMNQDFPQIHTPMPYPISPWMMQIIHQIHQFQTLWSPSLTTPQPQCSSQKHLTKPLSKPPSSSHSPKLSTP